MGRPAAKRSWAFSRGIGRDLEPIDGAFELRRAYVAADPGYTGRVTVPVLWDKERWTIVNNGSAEIMRMLNRAFDQWGDASVDLYPAHLREDIDRINARVPTDVNQGVYGCGFATSQAVYDAAFDKLFAALNWLEARLGDRRYLCGDRATEADWRLFTMLIRFDAVYYAGFRCNRQPLHEFLTCRITCASSTSGPASPTTSTSPRSSASTSRCRRSVRTASSRAAPPTST